MQVQVKKWGNSAAIRLPASVLKSVDLQMNDLVEIEEVEGTLVLKRVKRHGYALDDLLAGITDDNLHVEADFGVPSGREVW